MNPDEIQSNDQTGVTLPQSANSVNQEKSASNPFGPRPEAAPVFEVSQPEPVIAPFTSQVESLEAIQQPQQQMPAPQVSTETYQSAPTLPEQPVAAPQPAEQYTDAFAASQQNTSPVEATSVAPQPQASSSTGYPSAPVQTDSVAQQPQTPAPLDLPSFTAPPSGNQNAQLSDPNQVPKSKKIIMLVIAVIGGLLAIGIVAFLMLNLLSGDKFEKYSNDYFSIEYPKTMSFKEYDYITEFSESKKNNGSEMNVARSLHPKGSASESIELRSKSLKEETEEDKNLDLLSFKDEKINSRNVRSIVIREKKDLNTIDSAIMLVTNKENDTLYMLSFENGSDGIDIVSLADRITNSFTIKSK